MTIITLLWIVLAVVVGGSVAYWIIIKFLPAESRVIALAIVGVVLLLVLLYAFLPGSITQRVW